MNIFAYLADEYAWGIKSLDAILGLNELKVTTFCEHVNVYVNWQKIASVQIVLLDKYFIVELEMLMYQIHFITLNGYSKNWISSTFHIQEAIMTILVTCFKWRVAPQEL